MARRTGLPGTPNRLADAPPGAIPAEGISSSDGGRTTAEAPTLRSLRRLSLAFGVLVGDPETNSLTSIEKRCSGRGGASAKALRSQRGPQAFKMKSKFLILSALVALAGFLPQSKAALAVGLGTASSFAVLAGSGITVAGAVNTTTITGDIGTFPTPSITGLGNVVLNRGESRRGCSHAECQKRPGHRV